MNTIKRIIIAAALLPSLLGAPAYAATFSNSWSFFDQRTGRIVAGTVDGLSNGINLGANSLIVTVTSSPFPELLGSFNFPVNPDGPYSSYSAVNGVVTFANFDRHNSDGNYLKISTYANTNRFPSIIDFDNNKFIQNLVVGMSFAAIPAAVPETVTWALMMVGMGAVGFALRRKSKVDPTGSFA